MYFNSIEDGLSLVGFYSDTEIGDKLQSLGLIVYDEEKCFGNKALASGASEGDGNKKGMVAAVIVCIVVASVVYAIFIGRYLVCDDRRKEHEIVKKGPDQEIELHEIYAKHGHDGDLELADVRLSSKDDGN